MNNSAKVGSNPFDIFVIGARKGFNIAINNLMPNVLMAYVIAEMLNLLGVMQIIGHVCAPLMGLFGLPGEAITVLLTSWLSASAGTGVAVSLLSKGTLNVTDGTAKVVFESGTDDPQVLIESSGDYSETIELPSASNYIAVEGDGFTGSITLEIK